MNKRFEVRIMLDTLLNIAPYLMNLISGIILAAATYTINKARLERETERKRLEEKEKALSDGVESLLRKSLVDDYNKYSDRGFCPIYAKESVKRAYKAYHALGGNDVITELYHKILQMPEEPAERRES